MNKFKDDASWNLSENTVRAADLCFGDFMFRQLHHCKVPLPQGADDLVEADLQGPSLCRSGLSPPAILRHDHHGAATVWCLDSVRLVPAETKTAVACISCTYIWHFSCYIYIHCIIFICISKMHWLNKKQGSNGVRFPLYDNHLRIYGIIHIMAHSF